MNICIITEEFRPSKKGGIATWSHAVARHLQEIDGNEVSVLVKKRGGCDDFSVYEEAPIKVAPMRGRDWYKFHYFYSYYYLHRYLKSHPRALVIAATWELARAAVSLKRNFNPFLITAAHGLEITRLRQKKYRYRRRKFEPTVHGSNFVVPVSPYTENQIRSLCKSPPDNMRVIPNGTDAGVFSPASDSQGTALRNKYNLSPESKILLTLARVVPRKGHDIVIRALPRVLEKVSDLVYFIAGPEDPVWKQKLEVLIRELGLESHVRFLGYILEDEKVNLYQLCDLYIMISKEDKSTGDTEGFGITFLEANACGKAVIGSRSGGAPYAIEENISGLLVESGSADQTSEAIVKLITDKDLRMKLGKQGRKRVENQFTWDIIAKKIWDLYKQNPISRAT